MSSNRNFLSRSWYRKLATGTAAFSMSVAISACGGSNSVAGTSASNCVGSLTRAVATAPSGWSFIGLREISQAVAKKAPDLHNYSGNAPLCLVGFVNGRANNGRKSVVVEVYRLKTSSKLGEFELSKGKLRFYHPF